MRVTEPATGSAVRAEEWGTRKGRLGRVGGVAAVAASAAVAGLGLVWLLIPSLNPFGNGEMQNVVSTLLGPTAVAGVTFGLGAVGVAMAVTIVIRGVRAHPGPIGLGAGVLTVAFGVLLGSTDIISFAGYLFGCFVVVAGIIMIGVMLRRSPRLGLLLLSGLIVLLAVAVWLAGLSIDGVIEFAPLFGLALAAEAPNLVVVAVVVASTLVWAAVAVTVVSRGPGGRRFESWLVRHRRVLTVLAALGPVPYAVARITWLTPWPLFGPTANDMEPAVLVTGLMLGSGAVAASILTLGLILPWGRVYPRWMPRIGGHPVGVATAVAPGSVAAAMLCLSAAPMFVTMVGNANAPFDALVVNLVLPLWFWGPMLALAVWAYAAWRRDEARDV